MWEYSYLDERFEVVIKVKHNPYIDAQTLNQASQTLTDLTNEFSKKIRTLMNAEYSEHGKSMSLSHERSQ